MAPASPATKGQLWFRNTVAKPYAHYTLSLHLYKQPFFQTALLDSQMAWPLLPAETDRWHLLSLPRVVV